VPRCSSAQVEDYAARKGITVCDAEYWLRPDLSYEPAATSEQAANLRAS